MRIMSHAAGQAFLRPFPVKYPAMGAKRRTGREIMIPVRPLADNASVFQAADAGRTTAAGTMVPLAVFGDVWKTGVIGLIFLLYINSL
jgi:hypothetical protein